MKDVSCTSESASISIPTETFQTAQYIVEFVSGHMWQDLLQCDTVYSSYFLLIISEIYG